MFSPTKSFVQQGFVSRDEFIEKISSADFPKITTNKGITYYNIPAAFDIEVSSFYIGEEKCACMYIWQFGVMNWVTYGRTWDEFTDFISVLSTTLNLSPENRLVVYIHNFAYEFQFIRKRLTWDKAFFMEKRKPIYAISGGIEFRCSFKLSGKSLAKVGADLQKYKCSKKTGDLDYSIVRTSETQLTEQEMGYCFSDIEVLLCYIQEKIEQDKDVSLIPYTNTGYVRNYCRKACFARWNRYKALMSELVITPDEYEQLKQAFQGGFTHAAARYSRKIVSDVGSFDFTSSYPAVMVLEKFPMSEAKIVDCIDSDSQFEYYLRNYCCLITATFKNLRPAINYDHPISASKLLLEKQRKTCEKDNGRIRFADEATLAFTEQDYGIYKEFYDWDEMIIHKMRIYEKAYLPTSFVKSVLDLYKKKTVLKDVEGEEVNYMISKNMLNSSYGMMVTDIVRELVTYKNDAYSAEKPEIEQAIHDYNVANKRFLFYPWGVWVTAYARKNLFSGILECKDDYVYSDTDSIKVRNWRTHMDYIEAYNNLISRKIEASAKYHHLKTDLYSPLNQKGKTKTIGVWEFEGEYSRFKTVGAKRYIVEYPDSSHSLTVAGVNKKSAMRYLEEKYVDPFDGLAEGLIVPTTHSGRLLLDYCGDRSCEGDVVDYTGHTGHFSELSYIHMEPTTYELTYSDDYKKYIDFLLEVKDETW